MKKSKAVAIGFRAKTGRAIAVVLSGQPHLPFVVKKFELKLTDPNLPDTAQPYHVVMDLPWEQSQKAAGKSVRAIEAVARKALAKLLKELQALDLAVQGVGVVGSKDRDLARIGNYHIRAHAAEGILFRRVLELAAGTHQLRTRTFWDRELETTASSELGTRPTSLKLALNDLGRALDPPWRTDEKQAALAAWLMLGARR
ncbi:MAG TPA: hypothetical protein VFU37_00770 [Pyrinomonadaceae bacterium]|nr:hypothetical protein [Pyrinomonadaceae bacterium]